MNVTSAYGRQDIWAVQQTQRTSAIVGRVQPLLTSGRDTVSISPEAQERARGTQEQAVISEKQSGDSVVQPSPAAKPPSLMEAQSGLSAPRLNLSN